MTLKETALIFGFVITFFAMMFATLSYENYKQHECTKVYADSDKSATEIRTICFGAR